MNNGARSMRSRDITDGKLLANGLSSPVLTSSCALISRKRTERSLRYVTNIL